MTTGLTITAAARLARVTVDQVRAALDSGDLRDLTPYAVEAWTRSRIADLVTQSVNP